MKKKKLTIAPEIVKEIASELDMGMKCFYHKVTGELESYPDELRNDFDKEPWQDVMKKVKKDFKQYLTFEGMDSRESFSVMAGFIDEIPDKEIQAKFDEAINRRKPFQQFKYLLEDYPDLRQQWFSYKEKRSIEYVEEQLEVYNFPFQDNQE